MKKAGLIDLSISMMVLIAVIFSSCKKDQIVKENHQFKIDQLLKFVNVNVRIQNTYSRDRIIIVSWDKWGRGSQECRGWGLCNADWWPQFSNVQNPMPSTGSASVLERDPVTQKYFIDILLAETPPAYIPPQELALVIDTDIVLDTHQQTGNDLVFKAGNYSFNKSMGSFGGYRLYLN